MGKASPQSTNTIVSVQRHCLIELGRIFGVIQGQEKCGIGPWKARGEKERWPGLALPKFRTVVKQEVLVDSRSTAMKRGAGIVRRVANQATKLIQMVLA